MFGLTSFKKENFSSKLSKVKELLESLTQDEVLLGMNDLDIVYAFLL